MDIISFSQPQYSHEDLELPDSQANKITSAKKAIPITANSIIPNYREARREKKVKKGRQKEKVFVETLISRKTMGDTKKKLTQEQNLDVQLQLQKQDAIKCF